NRCWTLPELGQELHTGTVRAWTRTAPFAFVSVQAGLGLLTTMPIVPTGGLEVKVKQVLLQPASPTTNSNVARNEILQQLWRSSVEFSEKSSAIRHLRIGGSS